MSKNVQLEEIPAAVDLLASPPKGYQPPQLLAPIFAEFARTGTITERTVAACTMAHSSSSSLHHERLSAFHGSLLRPRFGGHDFTSLIGLVSPAEAATHHTLSRTLKATGAPAQPPLGMPAPEPFYSSATSSIQPRPPPAPTYLDDLMPPTLYRQIELPQEPQIVMQPVCEPQSTPC